MLFALILTVSGCLVLPAGKGGSLTGASGKYPGKLDLKFIQPHKTKRTEVVNTLRALDSGCGNEYFFWGRWSVPSVTMTLLFPEGGNLRAPSQTEYAVHNLLVEFDQEGVVQASRQVNDDQLISELRTLQAKNHVPPLDLSVSLVYPVQFTRWNKGIFSAPYEPGTIALSSDLFEFRDDRKEERNFSLPRSSLNRISHDSNATFNPYPDVYAVVLQFKVNESISREVHASVKLHDLMALLQFQSME